MRDDSSLHFRPGVSNHDQGKCITLELYFTFKLSAGEDAAFQFESGTWNAHIVLEKSVLCKNGKNTI